MALCSVFSTTVLWLGLIPAQRRLLKEEDKEARGEYLSAKSLNGVEDCIHLGIKDGEQGTVKYNASRGRKGQALQLGLTPTIPCEYEEGNLQAEPWRT